MQSKQPVKILHIITRLIIGGAQENTLYTVEGLNGLANYDVWLLTGPAEGPEGSLFIRQGKKIKIAVIPELKRTVNPFWDLIAFIRVYDYIKKNGFTIVHTHSSKAGIIGRWAAYFSGVPIIVHTIHGLPFHPYQNNLINFLYKTLEQATAKITKKMITVSNVLIDDALIAGICPKEKFITIYSGIELERFSRGAVDKKVLRSKLGIPHDAVVIGKIARLFHLKGHEFVLDAAEQIIKKYPDVYFLFVGEGILKPRLIAKTRKLNIKKNIIFAGLVSPDHIPNYIHIMDIVVHASLHEGLPRSVVEAFAARKPVICFDIAGARELLFGESASFLVRPGDVYGLIEKIVTLINNRLLAEDLGKRGYETVVKKFSKEKMVQDLDKLYQELLGKCGH
ncbi:MAG: glycosyltransferase family 4 protein [Candidatus Omnitrophota bacterium]